MAEYPCVECCQEADNNVLECSNCKNWVHRDCVQMSASAFRVWSVNGRTFLCRKCCFRGDNYDAQSGLDRLVSIMYFAFIYLFIYLFILMLHLFI